MAFADELKKKSTNYNPKQERINIATRLANETVNECICGIKDLCSMEAQKGKTNISGYLSVGRYSDEDPLTASVSAGRFDPYKDTRSGRWYYHPPHSFDYGIDGPEYEASNEDRLKIALLIKDGILNGLKDCGFSYLSASVVTKPHYSEKKTFFGNVKYSKDGKEIHPIYISISWE